MAQPNIFGVTEFDQDPETATELMRLRKQQAIADAMMGQSQQPLQGGMVGNVYVAPSITQGLAKLFQGYSAGRQQRDVEQGYQKLATDRRSMEDSERNKVIQTMIGRPEQPMGPPTEEGAMGVSPAVPAGTKEQVMQTMLASRLPAYRDVALKAMIADKTKAQEGYTLAAGASRYGPDGKLIVTAPKETSGKLGTEDVHIGGGKWQSFKVGKDGEVDLNTPIGQPFDKRPTASSVVATANAAVPKGDTKYAEERMKSRAIRMDELDKSAESAWKSNQALDRFAEASKNGTQGGAQPLISGAQNLLASFGYAAKDLKDVRQMEQAIGDILGSKMAELGARGLTDRDMDVLRQALPRVETDRASRENVVQILKKANSNTIAEWETQRKSEGEIYPELAKRIPEPAWYKQHQAGIPKKISTDADYNALPSGAVFIDPQGNQRRKP